MKDSRSKKTQKNKVIPSLVLLFIVLLLIFSLLLNLKMQKLIRSIKLNDSPITYAPNPYPILKQPFTSEVTAEGVAVLDANSHVMIYSKNPTRYFSPASTTKILTALTALDYFKLNDILTVRSEGVEGSTIGLKTGDKLKFEDLLYAMMLPSANDAALVISENYPGGENEFISKMNQKAKDLSLFSTHLEDPVGLEDQKNFSDPIDMVRLGDLAMENKVLAKIVGTKSKTIKTLGGKEFGLSNLNVLLGKDGVNGVKTGYTQTSGEVLVTSRQQEGNKQIIAVMQSENRFGDSLKIIEFLKNNLIYLTIHP